MVVESIKVGIYKNSLGNLYEVLNVAKNAETGELFVVYKALYGKQNHYIRSLKNFITCINKGNKVVSSFQYVSNGPKKVKYNYLKRRNTF